MTDPKTPDHTAKETSLESELAALHSRTLDGTGVASRFVTTGSGHRLHVLEAGAEHVGPTVVLVHGTGSAALMWLPLILALDDTHVVALDRPGMGRSHRGLTPEADRADGEARWLDQALDALGLPVVTLVGHSMGGLVSLRFVSRAPNRVERMALIGPPGLPGTRAPLPYRLLATPGIGGLLERLPVDARAVRRFASAMGEGKSIVRHPYLIDLLVALEGDRDLTALTREEVRALIPPHALVTNRGFRRHRLVTADQLAGVPCPVLVVWGENDPLGPPNVAQHVATMVPHGLAHVVPGGHVPWLGQPDRVAEPLRKWLAET